MAKKVLVVGHGDIKTTTTSRALKQTGKPVIPLVPEKPKVIPPAREHFKTDEEWNAFLEFTKPQIQYKTPKMPFKLLGDYLKEYNLIMKKESSMTATQRILVKNVIHAEVRKGTITLTRE